MLGRRPSARKLQRRRQTPVDDSIRELEEMVHTVCEIIFVFIDIQLHDAHRIHRPMFVFSRIGMLCLLGFAAGNYFFEDELWEKN